MADTPATGRDWLRGHCAALILTFDIDAESCMLAEGRRYAAHPGVMSHQAFGPLVGVPRILDMLKAQQVQATFFVPGVTAGRYPELIRRIDAEGHEIGHHSHSHRPPQLLTEEEERRDFEQGLDALAQLGIRPRGHRSALWAAKWTTAGLVAELGQAPIPIGGTFTHQLRFSDARVLLVPPAQILPDLARGPR